VNDWFSAQYMEAVVEVQQRQPVIVKMFLFPWILVAKIHCTNFSVITPVGF
jgi:hypothetical protein